MAIYSIKRLMAFSSEHKISPTDAKVAEFSALYSREWQSLDFTIYDQQVCQVDPHAELAEAQFRECIKDAMM